MIHDRAQKLYRQHLDGGNRNFIEIEILERNDDWTVRSLEVTDYLERGHDRLFYISKAGDHYEFRSAQMDAEEAWRILTRKQLD